jgi:hypothetical protein
MKKLKVLFLFLILLVSLTFSTPTMGWIAPYNTDIGLTNLETYGVKGLTYIAMQFWVPSGSDVKYVSQYEIPEGQTWDGIVKDIRDEARAYGVKAMLCVYNGENGWNWPQASTAINSSNRSGFTNSLITEMNRLDLDGVEVDLEGANADNSTDAENLVTFIEDLGDTLHALGKHLTIATFPSQKHDHIPDIDHWEDLLPHVDALTSMGYQEIGITGSGDLSYASQKEYAGQYSEKLMLGLPDHIASWLGTTPTSAVDWAEQNGVGVAIWEMRLGEGYGTTSLWQNASIWESIAEVRGPIITQFIINASAGVGGTINPLGETPVDSSESQIYDIIPSQYFEIDSVVVDGNSIGNESSYTFSNVKSEHTIEVFFKEDASAPNLYSISTSANSGGTITPLGEHVVAVESDFSFSISGNSGYVVDYVEIDGVDRGPIISGDIENVLMKHTIEAFFKEVTGGDLGKYENWEEPHSYIISDTIQNNDSLWEFNGNEGLNMWGSDDEPSMSLTVEHGANTPWIYSGLYDGQPDTLITATLDYRSSTSGKDTLIIETDTIVTGSSTRSGIDTIIVEGTPISSTKKIAKAGTQISIAPSAKAFTAPTKGDYSIKLFDLRGRVIFKKNISVSELGTTSTGINVNSLSIGVYLISVSNSVQRQVKRVKIK